MILTNKYLTPITDELLESLNPEVKNNFMDCITNIEFIKRMISPNRKYAKDLERDNKGKIIVDLLNPHILEDMEYFRPTGNYYRESGERKELTPLKPNGNPNSAYGKWFKEEVRRCWEGYVRESDGEWVTGDMYFYLNYCPIILDKIREGTTNLADRVIDFPAIWEGTYLWFHYLLQAREGGLYNEFKGGNHAVLIAKRGAGKSYSCAAILAKIFILGENKQSCEKTRGVVVAYQKESLNRDGTLNKFVENIDFCAEHTLFPALRLKDSLNNMHWTMGYKDVDTGVNKGTLNEVLGVTTKDNVEKSRGKRANRFIYEEFGAFKKFIDIWTVNLPSVLNGNSVFGQAIAIGTGGSEGCLTANNQVFTSRGNLVNINNLTIDDKIIGHNIEDKIYSIEPIEYINTPTKKLCIKITTNSLRELECSIDHPILSSNNNKCRTFDWIEVKDLKIGDKVAIEKEIPIFSNEEIFDARLVGMLIGDGSYISSPRITSIDKEILNYIHTNYDTSIYKKYISKDNREVLEIGIKNIRNLLRELGIYKLSKNNKRLPDKIFLASKENVCNLIAGLFDTNGYIGNDGIVLSSSCLPLLRLLQLLLIKLGIYANINLRLPRKGNKSIIKDKKGWYDLDISNREGIISFYKNIFLLVNYKLNSLNNLYNKVKDKKSWEKDRGFYYETIKNIEYIGELVVYNLSASNTHTYIGNGIITHNSDFSGALEIIYNPLGYKVYALPNFYDRNSLGNLLTVFFFGAYLNRAGFYDRNGNSDITGALLEILQDRFIVKYNSSDPNAITRTMAENPITILEAIMKRESTIYPVADLDERILELEVNPHMMNDVAVGLLKLSKGIVEFFPSNEVTPIRRFPHKDNSSNMEGAVEIYLMPIRGANNVPISGRYIAGIDPYDDDVSNTKSLGSIYILDLFTDDIVAEYTGRPKFAEDFYEICRRLLLFYNADANYENNKKGLYTYFNKYSCSHLLVDTLEFLKDKEGNGRYSGNKLKGTVATAHSKAYGRRCYRDYLLSTTKVTNLEGDIEVEVFNPKVSTMKLIALMRETALWDAYNNFDRHDAIIMLMLLREDRRRLIGEDSFEDAYKEDKNSLVYDPFFEKNYRVSRRQ